MADYRTIYREQAEDYDLLVAREDYQGQILPALGHIRSLAGAEAVELGAGTGRLTRLLAPHIRSIRAFDASAAMLAVAERRLQELGIGNCELAVADNKHLPIADASVDIAIAGWTLGHCTGWFPETWREEIGAALTEMRRVLRPGGASIILETMGTGNTEPSPPTPPLADYYAWLEDRHGFQRTWIRTDYRFQSLAEAERLTRFFFGDVLVDRVVSEGLVILPECTGIWWASLTSSTSS